MNSLEQFKPHNEKKSHPPKLDEWRLKAQEESLEKLHQTMEVINTEIDSLEHQSGFKKLLSRFDDEHQSPDERLSSLYHQRRNLETLMKELEHKETIH